MNIKCLIKPAMYLSGAVLVGATAFPLFLDRLNYEKPNKEANNPKDIPDEEVDPEYE